MSDGLIFAAQEALQVCAKRRQICETARMDSIPPHAAGRHRFATRLKNAGWPANDIATAGGWKNVARVQKTCIRCGKDSRRETDAIPKSTGKILTRTLAGIAKAS